MKRGSTRIAVLPGVAIVALAPLMFAPAAQAEVTDVSVVYSTQNNANAPIDGSYTVHGRSGQVRDDIQMTFTVQSDSVQVPLPVLAYSGIAMYENPTYSIRFGCDPTVSGSDCDASASTVADMNAAAAALDNRLVETFTDDVAPIIAQAGGVTPLGITGTVSVRVETWPPGTGALEFFVQEGSGANAERLSPTVTAPVSITRPTSTVVNSRTFCVAGLEPYTEDGVTFTPTEFGRATPPMDPTPIETGILPDDVTPVGTDLAGYRFDFDLVDGGGPITPAGPHTLTLDEVNASMLGSTPGEYYFIYMYTAPDGATSGAYSGSTVTVLGPEDDRCWSTPDAPVDPVDPTDPTEPANPTTPVDRPNSNAPAAAQAAPAKLAQTGADLTLPGLWTAGLVLTAGGALALSRRKRRVAR